LPRINKKSKGEKEMKITTFDPMILSAKADDVIKVFEDLGFEKHHAPTVDTGKSLVTSTRMKNEDGFAIDIAGVASMPRDMNIIRMNVDDFDAAYELLTSMGFKNSSGKTVDTETNKSTLMVSPTGFAFDLCQHIK
jgi:hypothetical protein